jgi:hypothetical protein
VPLHRHHEYGASELDLIAFENPRMANELGNPFIEILDENDKVLPYGRSNCNHFLYNKAHPLLDMTLVISILDEKYLQRPILKKLIEGPMMLRYYPAGKQQLA